MGVGAQLDGMRIPLADPLGDGLRFGCSGLGGCALVRSTNTLVFVSIGSGSGSGWHSRGIAIASELALFSFGFLSGFDQRARAFSDCFSDVFCAISVSFMARGCIKVPFSMRSFPASQRARIIFSVFARVHPKRRARRSRLYSGA